MDAIVFDDTAAGTGLFPFTLTRSALDIRAGILTLREKWEHLLGIVIPTDFSSAGSAGGIPSNMIPDKMIAEDVLTGRFMVSAATGKRLEYPWDITRYNNENIRFDFDLLTKGRPSASIPPGNHCISQEQIFIEAGAVINYSILNASAGPIYIGKNAEVMEGTTIRGPVAICEGAIVKMGTKIYGATTVGPHCVVGGEIKNSVLFGYTNKAHDGYLGDSVIGEWCNFGAGTSNSNIKNNAGMVRVWNEPRKHYIDAGIKCGLLMGDYSHCAINTSFNTGTVTGVSCNIFGSGLTPKYIPSFSWGLDRNISYEFEKAITDIAAWKKLKNHLLSDVEIQRLKLIFEQP